MTATVEELAPRTEDEVRAHLAAGKLVEGLQHMSPEYLKGIRRILTVSADTELVSAPAYLRAAAHAPALNNFGSAVSIIQDELAHAHIGYRLLGDLGVDMPALIYEREPSAFKYPYAFDVPLDSWHELVLANALYDQAGFVLLSDVHQSLDLRALEARAGQGRQGGDVPPAPRPHVGQEARRRPGREGEAAGLAGLDVHPHARVVRAAGRAQEARHPARVRLQGQVQRRAAPGLDGPRRPVHGRGRARRAGALRRGDRSATSSTARSRSGSTPRPSSWGGTEISWDEVMVRWKGRGPMNETYVATLQRGYRGPHRPSRRACGRRCRRSRTRRSRSRSSAWG